MIIILITLSLNIFPYKLNDFEKVFYINSDKIKTDIYTNNGKWWSSLLFGNVHKRICIKAFDLIQKEEYPDLWYYKNEIIDVCKGEDGHKEPKDNG